MEAAKWLGHAPFIAVTVACWVSDLTATLSQLRLGRWAPDLAATKVGRRGVVWNSNVSP